MRETWIVSKPGHGSVTHRDHSGDSDGEADRERDDRVRSSPDASNVRGSPALHRSPSPRDPPPDRDSTLASSSRRLCEMRAYGTAEEGVAVGSSGIAAVLCVAGMLVALVGCSSTARDAPTQSSALGDNAITVGSFNFAESEVLAEIYSQALEAGRLSRAPGVRLGPREFVAPALARRTPRARSRVRGHRVALLEPRDEVATADVGRRTRGSIATLAPRHITALTPAPAQDANTFVVTRATANRERLRTLSDVGRVAPG